MRPAGSQLVRYSGMSMWPGFQEGDLLEVAPVAIGTLRCGDIIVFLYQDGIQMVHRVVSTRRSVRTRGDALAQSDGFVVAEGQLAGKVIRRYRLGEGEPVHGGWRGRLLGRVYHLASRLNPAQPSRGGRLARLLRSISMRALGGFWRRGEIREVHLAGQPPVTIWYRGKRAIGRCNHSTGDWSLYWPWCQVLLPPQAEKPASLPVDSEAEPRHSI